MKKLILLTILVIVAQFLLMSKTVTYGDSDYNLDQKIVSLKNSNQKFELEIASSISCSALAKKVDENGFVKLTEIQSNNDLSIALRR